MSHGSKRTLTASDIIEDCCHDSSKAVIRTSSALSCWPRSAASGKQLAGIAVMDAVANAFVDGHAVAELFADPYSFTHSPTQSPIQCSC